MLKFGIMIAVGVMILVLSIGLLLYFYRKPDKLDMSPLPSIDEEKCLEVANTENFQRSKLDTDFCSSETCCMEFDDKINRWGPICEERCNIKINNTDFYFGQLQQCPGVGGCGDTISSIKESSKSPSFMKFAVDSELADQTTESPMYDLWKKDVIEKTKPYRLNEGGYHSNNFSDASGLYKQAFWNQGSPNDFSIVPQLTGGVDVSLGSGYNISQVNATNPETLGPSSRRRSIFKPIDVLSDNGVSLTWNNSIIRTRDSVSSYNFQHGLQTESKDLGITGNAVMDAINVSGTFNINTNRSIDSKESVSVRKDELFLRQGGLSLSPDDTTGNARIPYVRTDGLDQTIFYDLLHFTNAGTAEGGLPKDQYYTYKNNNLAGPDDLNADNTLLGYRQFMDKWGNHVLMEVAYGSKFIMRNFATDNKQISKDDMTMRFCMEVQPVTAPGVNPNTPTPPEAPNGIGNKHSQWKRIKYSTNESFVFPPSALYDLLEVADTVTFLSQDSEPTWTSGEILTISLTEVEIELADSSTVTLPKAYVTVDTLMFENAITPGTEPPPATPTQIASWGLLPSATDDPLFDFGMCANWTKEQYDEMRSKKIETKLKFLIGNTDDPIVAALLAKESLVGVTAEELQKFYDAGLTKFATPIGYTFVPIWKILEDAINAVYERNQPPNAPSTNPLDVFIMGTPKTLATPRGKSFWLQTLNNLKTAYIQATACQYQRDPSGNTITTWMDADSSTIDPNSGISTYQCKTLDYGGCMTDGDCSYKAKCCHISCENNGRNVHPGQGGTTRWGCDLATHNVPSTLAAITYGGGEWNGCHYNSGNTHCECTDAAKNNKTVWDSKDSYYCNIPSESDLNPA
jgi:hypothetical protein